MKTNKIQLPKEEVQYLQAFKKRWKKSLNELNRANILLMSSEWKKVLEIKKQLNVWCTMIYKTRQRYRNWGVEVALRDAPRPWQPQKYTLQTETELIALACSEAPEGRTRWTLELLTEEVQKKAWCETMNRETVRLILKKMNVSLG
jgi:hypothetical protein